MDLIGRIIDPFDLSGVRGNKKSNQAYDARAAALAEYTALYNQAKTEGYDLTGYKNPSEYTIAQTSGGGASIPGLPEFIPVLGGAGGANTDDDSLRESREIKIESAELKTGLGLDPIEVDLRPARVGRVPIEKQRVKKGGGNVSSKMVVEVLAKLAANIRTGLTINNAQINTRAPSVIQQIWRSNIPFQNRIIGIFNDFGFDFTKSNTVTKMVNDVMNRRSSLAIDFNQAIVQAFKDEATAMGQLPFIVRRFNTDVFSDPNSKLILPPEESDTKGLTEMSGQEYEGLVKQLTDVGVNVNDSTQITAMLINFFDRIGAGAIGASGSVSEGRLISKTAFLAKFKELVDINRARFEQLSINPLQMLGFIRHLKTSIERALENAPQMSIYDGLALIHRSITDLSSSSQTLAEMKEADLIREATQPPTQNIMQDLEEKKFSTGGDPYVRGNRSRLADDFKISRAIEMGEDMKHGGADSLIIGTSDDVKIDPLHMRALKEIQNALADKPNSSADAPGIMRHVRGLIESIFTDPTLKSGDSRRYLYDRVEQTLADSYAHHLWTEDTPLEGAMSRGVRGLQQSVLRRRNASYNTNPIIGKSKYTEISTGPSSRGVAEISGEEAIQMINDNINMRPQPDYIMRWGERLIIRNRPPDPDDDPNDRRFTISIGGGAPRNISASGMIKALLFFGVSTTSAYKIIKTIADMSKDKTQDITIKPTGDDKPPDVTMEEPYIDDIEKMAEPDVFWKKKANPIRLTDKLKALGMEDMVNEYNEYIAAFKKASDEGDAEGATLPAWNIKRVFGEIKRRLEREPRPVDGLSSQDNTAVLKDQLGRSNTEFLTGLKTLQMMRAQGVSNRAIEAQATKVAELRANLSKQERKYNDAVKFFGAMDKPTTYLAPIEKETLPTNLDELRKYKELQAYEKNLLEINDPNPVQQRAINEYQRARGKATEIDLPDEPNITVYDSRTPEIQMTPAMQDVKDLPKLVTTYNNNLQIMKSALEKGDKATYSRTTADLASMMSQIKLRTARTEGEDYDTRLTKLKEIYSKYSMELTPPEIADYTIPDSSSGLAEDPDTLVSFEDYDKTTDQGVGTLRAEFIDPAEADLFLSSSKEIAAERRRWDEYALVAPGFGLGGPQRNSLQAHNLREEQNRFTNTFKNPKPYTTDSRRTIERNHDRRDQPVFTPIYQNAYGDEKFDDANENMFVKNGRVLFTSPNLKTNHISEWERPTSIYHPEFGLYYFKPKATPIGEVSRDAKYRFTNERESFVRGHAQQANRVYGFPSEHSETMRNDTIWQDSKPRHSSRTYQLAANGGSTRF